jgi:hypothetical protein
LPTKFTEKFRELLGNLQHMAKIRRTKLRSKMNEIRERQRDKEIERTERQRDRETERQRNREAEGN